MGTPLQPLMPFVSVPQPPVLQEYRPANNLFVWNSIPFRDKIQTGFVNPEYALSNDGTRRGLRSLYFLWNYVSDPPPLGQQLVGWTTQVFGTPCWLRRAVPMPFDVAQNVHKMFACRVQRVEGVVTAGVTGQGWETATGLPAYDEGLATIEYESPLYEIQPDSWMIANGYVAGGNPDESTLTRYISTRFQPIGKYQTLPPFASLRWDDTLKPMAAHAVVLLYEGDLEITWHGVPVKNLPDIAPFVGKTNQFAIGGPESLVNPPYKAGTLVCCTPSRKYYRGADGPIYVDVTYKFRWYPFGANSFFRYDGAAPGFFPASRTGAGSTLGTGLIFPVVDYKGLWRPSA